MPGTVQSMPWVCGWPTQGLPVLAIQGFGVVMRLTHGSHEADKAEVG